jgi:[1-hydroxy-2-(trimethylamino)ethyl]phosphonate dioxygenase
MATVREIVKLLRAKGDSWYGREAVTQIDHALQAATLAEAEGAGPALIAAALLHDIGHLLHDLPADAPDVGLDDHHETSSANYLGQTFPAAVVEPIRLHVAAKRYLCTVDPDYFSQLSQPSVVSLNLQGGRMTPAELVAFEAEPFSTDAIRLRRWDDTAKVVGLKTLPLSHFVEFINDVALTVSYS